MTTHRFGFFPRLTVLFAVGALATSARAETLAYWTFGEKGLEDVSGHNVELKATNVDFGETGYATLNGTDAYLETTEPLDLTTCKQLTVECWIKPETPITDYGPLIVDYSKSGESVDLGSFVSYFGKSEHKLRLQLRDATSPAWTYTAGGSASSGIPYAEGGWHHVALVLDVSGKETWSSKAKLYVDGVKLAATSSSSSAQAKNFLNGKIVFGAGGSYLPENFFKGCIDDIRISSGCLEPNQFVKFPTFGRKQSAQKPELAHWTFGPDGLKDATGNGFDLVEATSGGVEFSSDCAKFLGKTGLKSSGAFPANAFSNSGLTYEFFFKTTSHSSDLAMLLENSTAYYSAPGRLHVRLNDNSTILNAGLRTATGGDNGYNVRTASVVPNGPDPCANDGEWHHVAVVYDPKGLGAERHRVYLDGAKLASAKAVDDNVSMLDGTSVLFIGCRNGTQLAFLGEMDDVRVMPWALAPSEFLKTRSVTAPLAHWKFEKAETALVDLTGNGHALVNQNGVEFRDGYAYFNGANANLITADALDMSRTKQVTIEGRFWFDDTTKLNVLFDTDDTTSPGGFVVYGCQNVLQSQFRVKSATWQQHLRSNFNADAGAWHHVAFVVNLDKQSADQSQMWVDGVKAPVNSGLSGSGTMSALNNTKLAFGGGGAYGRWCWNERQTSFKGRLAEVVVTKSELDDSSFRLLNESAEKVEIVKPEAVPANSVTVDLADKQDVTIECYAKLGNEPAGDFFSFSSDGGPTFSLTVEDGRLVGCVLPTTGGSNVETAALPTDGAWHHYALVIDGFAQGSERVRLYVDGVRASEHLLRVNWSEKFRSGTLSVGEDFAGKVSSVRVTVGVVPPEEFMSSRKLPGLAIILR